MAEPFLPVDAMWLTSVMLLSLRIGALLLLTPVFSSADLPVTVRVLLVFGLALALCAALGPEAHAPAGELATAVFDRPGRLLQAACSEVALGATMAVAIHTAFAAFAMAGRLLDIQVGFGLSQVFDPSFNASSPVLTSAFNRLATVVFFLSNGHHALLRALAYSLRRLPLGLPWSVDAAALPVLKQVGGLFGLSVALAAPVIFCVLMAELALGVLARNLPQMNMLTMGIPIKIVVGLVAISLWAGGIGATMDRTYRSIYVAWDDLFAAQPATAAGAR